MSSENDLPLTPISPVRNLRQTVTEHLRTAIIVGDLQEGVVYSAPSLGAAFGVSATPVREAMMDLAREGLVETVKNKGFRVTAVKERDLDEITEIRLLLEPLWSAASSGASRSRTSLPCARSRTRQSSLPRKKT